MRSVVPPPMSFTPGGSARYAATSPCRSSGNGSNTSSPLAHDENDFSKMNLHHQRAPAQQAADPATSAIGFQSPSAAAKTHSTTRNSNTNINNISPLLDDNRGVVPGNKTPDRFGTGALAVVSKTHTSTLPGSPLDRKTSFSSPIGIKAKRDSAHSSSGSNNNNNTLMTVTSRNHDIESSRSTAVTPRRRDDNSVSSNKERKEDDPVHLRYEQPQPSESSAMPPFRSTKPTSESGRARGATPPRPVGHLRSRSNDGAPMMTATLPPTSNNTGISDTQQPSSTPQPAQQRRSSRRSASPNRIPRVPNKQSTSVADGTSSQNSSPRRFSNNNKDHSGHSLASSGGGSMSKRSTGNSHNWQWAPPKADPADHEQALFEQRLCEDAYGVAVRKINQNGKPNLRYVKCIYVMESDVDTVGVDSNYQSSTRSSISSLGRSFRKSSSPLASSNNENSSSRLRVLTWGKKKDVKLPLERFVSVRKGKTTDRARRNSSPSCRILSLITTDPHHQSLDIEAPTRLDRDKFARAFARFLEVPLVGEDQTAQSVSSARAENNSYKQAPTTAMSEPDLATTPKQAILEAKRIKQQKQSSHNAPLPVVMASGNSSRSLKQQVIQGQTQWSEQPLRNSGTSTSNNNSGIDASSHSNTPNPVHANQKVQIASLPSSLRDSERSSTQAATASRPTHPEHEGPVGDDTSQVSSLTGAGFDQEIVEELHQALTELRAELEESRAEAARAVKVAEQAIQSAENSSSNDWNSTVTHKAAEAAALAQKKSAEAMAKQRLAEERLEGERRTAAFWRRQAEAAEEEAGTLQTRAAAAEVQRAAMVEELECERRKAAAVIQAMASNDEAEGVSIISDGMLKLQDESTTGVHDLVWLTDNAKARGNQVSPAVMDAQAEISLLREKLALESAARRKLLHEVQDLRGVVRVYCRPTQSPPTVKGMLSIPSQDTLLLHPYEDEPPVSFKFDRVFTPDIGQREVYNEIEELCLSVLDGYNICLLAHGQRGTGKTYSLLGDVVYSHENGATNQSVGVEIEDHGIHLRTVQQLFSISEHRSERYQDTFTLEIVEVHNERLHDLLAGTELGETRGSIVMEESRNRSRRGMSEDGSAGGPPQLSNSHSVSSKQGSTMTRLEIRTNHNGDTVVQGLLSVEVKSFDDVYKLWQQCLSQRATRLAEQGADLTEYEASSHVIATLSVVSVNAATGMGSVGKVKFVDLAGADLVQRRGNHAEPKLCLTPESNADKGGANSSNNSDWKYSNRSLATLNDVVNCRSQFMRSVPYRNSTLTHLLRDNLEADTKVLLLLCVSPHKKDLQETACALRFASGMRRVTIGKATKHTLNRS